MKINRFEDIIAWQKAKVLTVKVYSIFNVSRDFGFRDQICRAAVSTMNNIAEGFERRSDKEFKNFLFIAKGSCGELRSMLHVGVELNYISKEEYDSLVALSNEVSKLLSGLIKSLN